MAMFRFALVNSEILRCSPVSFEILLSVADVQPQYCIAIRSNRLSARRHMAMTIFPSALLNLSFADVRVTLNSRPFGADSQPWHCGLAASSSL